MMRLFKKLQAKKRVVFAPELKNLEVKGSKKIAQKKVVPRFLTRGIILKLKKNQSINSTLAFASVAFTFYQNESKNRGKGQAAEDVASSLVFTFKKPKVFFIKDQGDKYNKNVNSLKEHKSVGNNIINIKPIKVLQKKTELINMFHSTFLKIKPFFNILQKFSGLLLKKNVYLVRPPGAFIYAGLKGASTISGFKKVLYNKILMQDRRLKPAYNRRKHNTSHYMVVQNQFARLDKAFVYLGKNKLASIVGLVLKVAYSAIPPALGPLLFNKKNRRFFKGKNWAKTKKHNYFNDKLLIRGKAIPNLVSILEGQVTLLLWRNQFNNSLTKSRQDHKQGVSQNFNVICKNNTAILLKESVYVKPKNP